MSTCLRFCLVALIAAIAACERETPTAPSTGESAAGHAVATPSAVSERTARERLARRLALALGDPAFRAAIKTRLDRSPEREHKIHFQRFLQAENHAVLRDIARLSRGAESSLDADAGVAVALELYLPVAAHRAGWTGGPDVLVATEREDGEAPVAFDIRGRRLLLSPSRPPVTPVLALVPVETTFDSPTASAPFICCAGGPPPSAPAGLYMTASHFTQDFEGWLKGEPEFEIHILGQSGQTDSLNSYQCAGEHASGYYGFDQNGLDWSGSVLLFNQSQLDSYRKQHPNQNFRIMAFEDDDGACAIRLDNSRFKSFISVLQSAYPNLTGGKDTTTSGLGRIVKRANALQKILRAAYSFITTQDDLIGNAIEDVVAGESHAGFNWIVKGENNTTTGWIALQMK
jgi:hypothetical protein